MCADTAVNNNLSRAMAVIIIGGIGLGWLGGKAVDYTFNDVRENTEFRIGAISELNHVKSDVEDNTRAIKELALIKELVIRIDERTSKWEPNEDLYYEKHK